MIRHRSLSRNWNATLEATMLKFTAALPALIVALTMTITASASPLIKPAVPAGPLVSVQYGDLCTNWHQGCARLHGYRTRNWHACMNQPQAQDDCGSGAQYGGRLGGYVRRGPSEVLCGNWHRGCGRMHGWRTPAYAACMHQPQALEDCGQY